MVVRLKDFIRQIRQCKTAADERAVIVRESAAIRTSFKEDAGSVETRHNNIAKMLYIHMLGYPAHFGQIECLKLVAAGKYPDKRLGYLGIGLLLDESQEVLTLVTNSLKNDMNSQNMYTVGLALVTLGNIASVEMARDLAPEVDRLMGSSNSYIKKKAVLCAVKVLTKVPDLVDQFMPKAKAVLSERNHAVLLSGMSLVSTICELDTSNTLSQFRSMVPYLIRHLKSLITAGNSAEHDVGGINDPFLQVRILRLLRVLGKGDKTASDAMNDVLAQIATNTDGTKNVGNAILYETCLTIMEIEADNGLRVLAVNILGKFLSNTDNNIRYVALNTLTKTISVDVNAVQRHRNTILECLHDPDISIRRRALELSFFLINESNVRVMIRELLMFLEVADEEFKYSMPARICQAADLFAPNKRWHIDTVIRVLKSAGNYVKEEVLSNFIKLVAAVGDLHAYSVYKLFYSVKADMSQESLVLAAVWCIGEYGDVLVRNGAPKPAPVEDGLDEPSESVQDVSDKDVLDLFQSILESSYCTNVIVEYVLMSLLKLTTRVNQPSSVQRIQSMIQKYSNRVALEIQQRSVEFTTLLGDPSLEKYRKGVLERVPVPPPTQPAKLTSAQASPAVGSGAGHAQNGAAAGGMDILGDLNSLSISAPAGGASDLLAGLGSPSGQQNAPKNVDLLADIFGSGAAAPSGPKSTADIMNLFGSSGAPAISPKPAAAGAGGAFSDLGILSGMTGASQRSISPASSFTSPPMRPTPLSASTSPNMSVMNAMGSTSPVLSSTMGSPSAGLVAYQKNGLVIEFTPSKEASADPSSSVCSILAIFKNTGSQQITDLNMQVAVPKTLKLQLLPLQSNTIVPGGTTRQQVKILNPSAMTPEGKGTAVRLRLKIMYRVGAQAVDEVADFGGFPQWSW